jgi:GntR family transcriptional regulator
MSSKLTPTLARVKNQHMTLTDATSELIFHAIQDGTFAPGSQLLPEIELMRQLGVSRTTLREALKRLEEQGFIIRRRGLGTFICERSIIRNLSINFGITDMIREAGLEPGTLSVKTVMEEPSPEVAKALDCEDKIIIIDRVRTANDRPVVISLDMFPTDLLKDRQVNVEKLKSMSIYEYMILELGIRVVRGTAQVSPILASKENAEKLNVKRGTPLLCIVQLDYDSFDKPVLYTVEYHLPDAFVFQIERKGPNRY